MDRTRERRLLTYARAHFLAAEEALHELATTTPTQSSRGRRLETMRGQAIVAADVCLQDGASVTAKLPPYEMGEPMQRPKVIAMGIPDET